MENNISPADSAAHKMATGNLMTINEVAARLGISPMTVHRLQLKSIRIGRLLRFDPKDVERLIDGSKEPVITPEKNSGITDRHLLTSQANVGLS